MRITEKEEKNGQVTLKLEGSLCPKRFEILKQQCVDHVEKGKTVQLDLTGLTFVPESLVEPFRSLFGPAVRIGRCSGFIGMLIGKGAES